MGGNVDLGFGKKAQPIMFNKDNIEAVWKDVRGFFDSLSEAFLNKHQWPLTVEQPFVGSSAWVEIDPTTFVQHRQFIGDVDVQVYESNREWLKDLLEDGSVYGGWTVVGTKAHGNELSALVGRISKVVGTTPVYSTVHQFDFQFVSDPGSKKQQFLHLSPLSDLKEGFKGAYHKILLNAIGLDEYKFSITHGLRRRDNNEEVPFGHYCEALFGEAIVSVYSFVGLVDGVVDYLNDYEGQRVLEKFESHVMSTLRHEPACLKERAIGYLRDAINAR